MKSQFEELGWGAVLNPEHDLGTDLWLMARDARRFDLGLLVGAQVKTGLSYFQEEHRNDAGDLEGWWYRENDTSHFEYWKQHSIPHILVLHRPSDKKSFWVHVRSSAVESTGKGAKILVPANQTIDADYLSSLIEVASTRLDVPQWEGSAWNIGQPIPGASLLRYALITPRLVAPHPNASREALQPEQAIALLTQLRLHELQNRYGDGLAIDVEECRTSPEWAWRLYAAFHDWLMKGASQTFTQLIDDAATAEARTAAAVIMANALVEQGLIGEAVGVLDAALALDDANPVDNAWLRAHKARCLREMGALDAARELAFSVQEVRWTAPSDPTAAAVAAAAAYLVFTVAEWTEETIGQMIQQGDTVAAWWRSQVIATALNKDFDQDFREWGRDKSFTFGAGDEAWLKLRSASLLAGFAADHSAWRHTASLLARRQLMTAAPEDHGSLKWALHLLRHCGEEKELQLAVQRLGDLGPTEVLRDIGAELDLDASTRTSLLADLRFVKRAADVLRPEDAERHALWALYTLENADQLRERLQPTFLLEPAVLEMLTALITGLSTDTKEKVQAHIVSLPALEDQLLAHEYARLLDRVADQSWSDRDIQALANRPGEDNFEFSDEVNRLLASLRQDFRETLLQRIRDGDMAALHSYGDVRDLPESVVVSLIGRLAQRIAGQLDEARRTAYGVGVYDFGGTLVLVNAWHPEVADWAPVEQLLAEPLAHPDHLVGAVELLGRLADQVPHEVRERLEDPLRSLMARQAPGFFFTHTDIRGPAALTFARLFPDSVDDTNLRSLIRGTMSERAAAIDIVIGRENTQDLNLIAALSCDPDDQVRATAARGLARWITRGIAADECLSILRDLLAEPGTLIGRYVSAALLDPSGEANRGLLLPLLKGYPSALVRARVDRLSSE